MKLTGKDVYEAARPFLEKQGLESTDWESGDFGQGTQEFYNAIAEKLNVGCIAPLQGLVRELLGTLEYCWDNEFPVDGVEELQKHAQALLGDEQVELGLMPTEAGVAMAEAMRVQADKIAPLQGLLKDYQEFTKYQTPLLKAGRLAWEAESNELSKRAQALLKEEH